MHQNLTAWSRGPHVFTDPIMASHPVTGIPTHYEDGDEHNYSRGAIREEQKHHLHNNVKGYMRSKYRYYPEGIVSPDTKH